MPRSSLEALCRVGASERYDLNSFLIIPGSRAINDASSLMTSVVGKHLQSNDIESFCFGVCDIQKRDGITFICGDPSTWNRKSLNRHHSELSREDPGRNGFIALAILASSRRGGMDYALRLRDKMNERYNITNSKQIAFDERAAEGYVLYMAFSLQGNGYVLETQTPVSGLYDMAYGVEMIVSQINTHIHSIEEISGRRVKHFYIGKSSIQNIENTPFDCNDPDTWRTDAIEARYNHCRKAYGRSGLLVVAVVTRESIPAECLEGGYVNSAERYALELERSLIKRFSETSRERLVNTGTDPGRTDEGDSSAYVIYIAFSLGVMTRQQSLPQSQVSLAAPTSLWTNTFVLPQATAFTSSAHSSPSTSTSFRTSIPSSSQSREGRGERGEGGRREGGGRLSQELVHQGAARVRWRKREKREKNGSGLVQTMLGPVR